MGIWEEDYRPTTINDCILPERIKSQLQEIVQSGDIPNMLFAGSHGLGKTSSAKALADELNADLMFINASDESGIDTIRNKVKQFASTMSLHGAQKIVVLDEADYLNKTSTQPALRAFIEEFSKNCRFILTANYKNRILGPLRSRLATIEFYFNNKEKPQLMYEFHKRVKSILQEEDVKYDEKALAKFINSVFPDFRKILAELHLYSKFTKEIDVGILETTGETEIENLVPLLRDKEFTKMREWVAKNPTIDGIDLFTKLYENMYDYVHKDSIPNLVVLLHDAQLEYENSMNKEICIVANLTTIMGQIQFK